VIYGSVGWLLTSETLFKRLSVRALRDPARRGVDIKLTLPSQTDSWAPLYAERSHCFELLEAAAKIYERHSALLHAKTAVIDRASIVDGGGSSNLDWRSFMHNYEPNVVILGPVFGAEMVTEFNKDLAMFDSIQLEPWHRRSQASHLRELAAWIWEYWL
jgi:cardiolipin synthase A/B